MKPRETVSVYFLVALHALGWLCFANIIGAVLALMLLVPSVNELFAPLTYGRLIPLHLNGHLYGWCFIPLVGILFAWYFEGSKHIRSACFALEIWSIALGAGCLYWLAGISSGKLFMEWRGGARCLLSVNMLVLAGVLLLHMIREPDPVRLRAAGKWLLWLFLLPVPAVMYLAADPARFPPVNPDSGGATGGSLLVSSLGAVTIMWLTPFLLQLKHNKNRCSVFAYVIIQVFHYALFSFLEHGDQSHHSRAQMISLASLVIWVPLLIHHFKKFEWPDASSRWLWSFALWGAFLVVSANIMFSPGLLDRWKFTNFLVGHTHAAMAGMLSSFNMLILITINKTSSAAGILGRRGLFWGWNIGVILHVAVLKYFGILEGAHADWLYTRPELTGWIYSIRLLSGLIMLAVSLAWLSDLLKSVTEKNHA